MAQRYVRVQSKAGQLHYGLLQPDRGVLVLDAPPWLEGQVTETLLPPGGYTLLAPCSPSKVIAVGKNYADHAAEMGTLSPKEPLLFLKPSTAVTATGTNILYPSRSQRVDYEGELAIVIGRRTTNCTPDAAQGSIWGYTIANDVTARDLQLQDGQWTRAKGYDTFCPLGPWIVRELSPGTKLQTFLNSDEKPVQSAAIEEMTFSPELIVSHISYIMTMLPGDVILTGTPSGVGPLKIGDQVKVEVEGIGILENSVIARPTTP